MIAHIAKRIAFVILGYFAGLAAGAMIFPGIVLFIAYFKPDSNLWQLLGLGLIAGCLAGFRRPEFDAQAAGATVAAAGSRE